MRTTIFAGLVGLGLLFSTPVHAEGVTSRIVGIVPEGAFVCRQWSDVQDFDEKSLKSADTNIETLQTTLEQGRPNCFFVKKTDAQWLGRCIFKQARGVWAYVTCDTPTAGEMVMWTTPLENVSSLQAAKARKLP